MKKTKNPVAAKAGSAEPDNSLAGGTLQLVKAEARRYYLRVSSIVTFSGIFLAVSVLNLVITGALENSGYVFRLNYILLFPDVIDLKPWVVLAFLWMYFTRDLESGVARDYHLAGVSGGRLFTVKILPFFVFVFVCSLVCEVVVLAGQTWLLTRSAPPKEPFLSSVVGPGGWYLLERVWYGVYLGLSVPGIVFAFLAALTRRGGVSDGKIWLGLIGAGFASMVVLTGSIYGAGRLVGLFDVLQISGSFIVTILAMLVTKALFSLGVGMILLWCSRRHFGTLYSRLLVPETWSGS